MSSASLFEGSLGLKKPVCVFCGASPGTSPLYAEAARAVGAALAKDDIPLVYGGGRRGIMGVVSQSALEAGGRVHGIIPQALLTRVSVRSPATSSGGSSTPQTEESKEGSGTDFLKDIKDGRYSTEVTDSMHSRKLRMAQLSTGGFIVLPGGYGTFEEMMEMITWNQLGIHRLPVVILNIGNFYSSVRTLLENAVEAGFIAPQNLSLCKIVDLPGGAEANSDLSKAGDWGEATLKALQDWSLDESAGFGLQWQLKKETGETPAAFSLFTTMRFTTTGKTRVTKDNVPLLDKHIDRLREAHQYFSREAPNQWGRWLGDDEALRIVLGKLEQAEVGDWRARVLLHPGPKLEVQLVPAPPTAGPFKFAPDAHQPSRRRPLALDSAIFDPSGENGPKATRLYKTTDRSIYDEAGIRGEILLPGIDHPEVLLRTATHLLESVTSNIALYIPPNDPSLPVWVTPKLDAKEKPFLDGVMRRYLLERGIIREGEVTVEDWIKVKSDGGRVIGFNGLRGVWEAEPR